MDVGLDVLQQVVETTGKPSVVMTYVNPVLKVGIDEFAGRVERAGGSGVIIADLPVDEAGPFARAFRSRGIGLILFVAPTTTEERLERVMAAKPAFVYGIAEVGVTGERASASSHIADLVKRVRRHGDIPVVAGVGISSAEQARVAAAAADGVIVGSTLVRRVLEASDVAEAVHSLGAAVGELAKAVRLSD